MPESTAKVAREDPADGQFAVVAERGSVLVDADTLSFLSGAADRQAPGGAALFHAPLSSVRLGVKSLRARRIAAARA